MRSTNGRSALLRRSANAILLPAVLSLLVLAAPAYSETPSPQSENDALKKRIELLEASVSTHEENESKYLDYIDILDTDLDACEKRLAACKDDEPEIDCGLPWMTLAACVLGGVVVGVIVD